MLYPSSRADEQTYINNRNTKPIKRSQTPTSRWQTRRKCCSRLVSNFCITWQTVTFLIYLYHFTPKWNLWFSSRLVSSLRRPVCHHCSRDRKFWKYVLIFLKLYLKYTVFLSFPYFQYIFVSLSFLSYTDSLINIVICWCVTTYFCYRDIKTGLHAW